jgi:hypothetical protein
MFARNFNACDLAFDDENANAIKPNRTENTARAEFDFVLLFRRRRHP